MSRHCRRVGNARGQVVSPAEAQTFTNVGMLHNQDGMVFTKTPHALGAYEEEDEPKQRAPEPVAEEAREIKPEKEKSGEANKDPEEQGLADHIEVTIKPLSKRKGKKEVDLPPGIVENLTKKSATRQQSPKHQSRNHLVLG